uniref:DUF5641 domain-containing protein n=1 Tax=Strigamia maritima TaxID=126957 RepID=T1IKR1_STRMM
MSIAPFGIRSAKFEMRNEVQVTLRSREDSSSFFKLQAIAVPYITSSVTKGLSVDVQKLLDERGIELNPERTEKRSEGVSVLVGTEYFWHMVNGRIERLVPGLVALETRFGWTIHGSHTISTTRNRDLVLPVNLTRIDEKLDCRLQQFWELDAIGIKHESHTDTQDADQQALESFHQSLTWKDDRYEVRLPWLTEKSELDDNYNIALRRFWNLIRKFKQDPNFDSSEATLTRTCQEIKQILSTAHMDLTKWVSNSSRKIPNGSPLTVSELQDAEKHWIRFMQRESFGREVTAIKAGQQIKAKSRLTQTPCVMDENELLQVKTRVPWSEVHHTATGPWVIDNKHYLTQLIVRDAHVRVFHGGLEDTLAELRQRFWIPRARTTIKKTLRDCFVCRKIWKRWRHEYLTELRVFNNTKRQADLRADDVVLIQDENQPRSAWIMGQITEVFKRRDGHVRSCEIRLTTGKTLRRPVQRLCVLETHDEGVTSNEGGLGHQVGSAPVPKG